MTAREFTNEPVKQTIGGREFLVKELGPLTMLSFAQKRLKEKRIEERKCEYHRQLDESREMFEELDLTAEERKLILENLLEPLKAPIAEPTDEEALEWLNTKEGTIEFVHKAVTAAGETVPFEEFYELMDADASESLRQVASSAMGAEPSLNDTDSESQSEEVAGPEEDGGVPLAE